MHRNLECETFAKHNYKINADLFNYDSEEQAYAIISPIRTLMTKKNTGKPRITRLIIIF